MMAASDEGEVQRDDVEVAPGREEAGGDQQRVAGQEEPDHEAGLGEDDEDEAEEAADPDQLGNVVDGPEEVLDQFQHAGRSPCRGPRRPAETEIIDQRRRIAPTAARVAHIIRAR